MDDDRRARRGGTAIAMGGTEVGWGWGGVQHERRDAGYGITMRDEICIAYGVLLIYLVKSLGEAGIYYYIYMNERRLG